ncbi:hypothetical protein CLOLEP_01476 [[Clostridium] leptum DSM 753]|uniref:Uncharacterized protein n=1 Tax=[Clostridium] leptum DSM 753 TaxID=428125 RepID=A7VSD4_9FIRM|nr:hypothetical protein CLOLEP_01476 [[Clostridium] leptum DSM 753]
MVFKTTSFNRPASSIQCSVFFGICYSCRGWCKTDAASG